MDASIKAKELLKKLSSKDDAIIFCNEIISTLNKLRKPEYTTFIEWKQLRTKEEADTWDGYEYIAFWRKVKSFIRMRK